MWWDQGVWREKCDEALIQSLLKDLIKIVINFVEPLFPMDKIGLDMLNVLLSKRTTARERCTEITLFVTLDDFIEHVPRLSQKELSRWCWIPQKYVSYVVYKYAILDTWTIQVSKSLCWDGSPLLQTTLQVVQNEQMIMVEFNCPKHYCAVFPVKPTDTCRVFDLIHTYGTQRLRNRTNRLFKPHQKTVK